MTDPSGLRCRTAEVRSVCSKVSPSVVHSNPYTGTARDSSRSNLQPHAGDPGLLPGYRHVTKVLCSYVLIVPSTSVFKHFFGIIIHTRPIIRSAAQAFFSTPGQCFIYFHYKSQLFTAVLEFFIGVNIFLFFSKLLFIF